MGKIKSIIFNWGSHESSFEVGRGLLDKDGKESEVKVMKITAFFKRATIYLSSGEKIIHRYLDYSIRK